MNGESYNVNPGVNKNSIKKLFDIIYNRRHSYKYELSLSYLEIYNEKIKDLLIDKDSKKYQNNINKIKDIHKKSNYIEYLRIKGNGNNIKIEGLNIWNDIKNINDIEKALKIGNENRSIGVTNMNEHSSRSHSILTIYINGINIKTNTKLVSKLNLIDLAGSERVSRSEATGNRLKEAQNINKSLSALGNVIESLKKKNNHIPFRDSKLTHLLQESLSNQSKVLMFVNISPNYIDIDETFCSLLFANRVRNTALGQAKKNIIHSNNTNNNTNNDDNKSYNSNSFDILNDNDINMYSRKYQRK